MSSLLRRRLYRASLHSINGLKSAWQSEEAFRIEALFGLTLFVAAFFLGETRHETAILILSVFIVLIAELLNTGLEKIIDRISLEKHENSRLVKDVGSAAVFLSIIQMTLIWIILLL